MATLTGKLVADTYKALLKMIDNDVVTATEKQISDGLGGGTGIFIDQDGEIRASKYRVTAGTSSQFLKADGSLDSTSYLPSGTTTTSIPEGSNLYFTNSRVLNTTLNGFTAVSGTVTSADSVLTAIEKIWWNIVNGGGGGGGGYVPYVGATQNLNLGEYGLLGGFVQFDTTPTTAPNAVGALSWNDQDGTLDLKLKGGNVTLQIGQEQVTRVVNKTGVNLLESNYQAVRISGAQGNRLKVALAQANNDANSAETLGLVTENINDNNEGFITSSGLVRDINTTGSLQGETWADGDILYLSGTTAGRVTNIKPQAPIHTVIIGFVVRAHATQGAIYVKVDNGYELDELHNVKITAPEDKDFLVYDGTNLYWENRSIYGTEGYLPIYDDIDILKDSIIYSDGVGIGVGTNILEPTAIATFFGNIDLVTGTYLTSDGFNLIGRGNLINQIEIGSQNASDYLTFIAGNAERARITAAGNFGIGLTNPSAPLHIKGSTYTNVIVDNNSATGGGSYLSYQNGTKKALFGLSGAFELNTGSDVAIASTIAGGGIKFYTNNSTTQAMGIVSSGNAYLGQAPTFLGLGTEFIVRGQASDGVLGVMDSTEAVKGLFISNSSLSWLGTYSNHPLAFRTNNTEWARISSAGNLLIGTIVDNATDKLQVNGTSYFADNIVLADSKGIVSSGVNMLSRNNLNNQIIIGADGGINDNVAFYSGDLERMRLLANGRLAINKTTASYQVDVQGDVNVSGAFRVNGTIIPNGTVTSVAMSVPTGLVISGSPITSSGTLAVTYAVNYGIPTLTKQSDWDDAYTWVTNFPDQLGNSGKFLTTNGSVLSWASLVTGVSSVFGRTGAVTAQSGDYTTAQVTESGNLYYTDARARLALSASAPLSYNNGTGAFSISQASGSTNGFLSSTDWNTFNNKQNALGYTPVPTTRTLTINGTSYDLSADRSWTIASGIGGSGTTNYIPKFTASTTIGNSNLQEVSGNLGLGVTPSAWLSGYPVIQMPQLSIFSGAGGGGFIFGNAFLNTSGSFIYQNSGLGASAYNNQGGGHQWSVAPSGTAGTAISFTQAMTLDASGNLGLGMTSPTIASGYRSIIINGTSGSIYRTQVNGTTAFDIQADTITYLWENRNTSIAIGTNGTERMRINAGGNVSIGNTNNTYKLDVNNVGAGVANTRIYGNDQANVRLRLENAGAGGRTYEIVGGLAGANNSSFSIFDATASSTRLQIDSNGAATFSSSVTSYGNASSSNAHNFYNNSGTSGTAQYYAEFGNGAGFVAGRILRGNGASGFVPNGLSILSWDSLQLSANATGGSGGSIQLLGGNVGIGSTSPSNGLLVINSTSATGVRFALESSGTMNGIVALGNNAISGLSTTDMALWTRGVMAFETGASGEKMRITSGGQLLVGLTSGYSNGVTIKGASDDYSLTLAQSNASNAGWGQWADTGGNYKLSRYGGGAYSSPALTITLAGAATFSSSVTAGTLNAISTLSGASLNISGTQSTFRIASNYTGGGDLLSGTLMYIDDVVNNNLTIIPSSAGTNGSKIVAAAYNGSAWRSMWEFANTNSGNPNLILVKSGGNVGIGTTSPSVLLQLGEGSLSNSTINQYLRINSGTYNAISSSHLDLFNFGNNFGNALGWRITSSTEGVGISVGRYLSFNTVVTDGSGNPSTATERMRITSGGNVGIGTTSPSNFGGGGLTLGSTSSGKNLILNSSSAGNNGLIQFLDTAGNDAFQIAATTSIISLYGYTTRNMTFATSGTERMRITSGGQIYMGNSAGDGYRLQIFGTNQADSTFGQTYIGVAAYSQWVNSSGAFVMGLDGASGTTERMRITSTGNVGIGTTSPSQKLTLSNTDADVLIDFVRNGTNRGTIGHKFVSGVQNELGITANYPTTIGFYTNGARRLYIDPFGKVGVNTTSFATSDYFKVEGQTSINGDLILHSSTQLGYGLSLPNASNTGEAVAKTWVVYSDARVKKNVSELNYGIDSIKKLKPISYNHHNSEFKNGEINILEKYKYEIGFIAQEVYDVIPEVVNPGNDTQLWTMNYERLTSVIVKGMQEQQVMIETNAEKIARLEKEVSFLKTKIA